MKEELEEAQGWFHKAESDLVTARRTAASEGPYDTACFHAQQAAEKYLKGFLIACGQQCKVERSGLKTVERLESKDPRP